MSKSIWLGLDVDRVLNLGWVMLTSSLALLAIVINCDYPST